MNLKLIISVLLIVVTNVAISSERLTTNLSKYGPIKSEKIVVEILTPLTFNQYTAPRIYEPNYDNRYSNFAVYVREKNLEAGEECFIETDQLFHLIESVSGIVHLKYMTTRFVSDRYENVLQCPNNSEISLSSHQYNKIIELQKKPALKAELDEKLTANRLRKKKTFFDIFNSVELPKNTHVRMVNSTPLTVPLGRSETEYLLRGYGTECDLPDRFFTYIAKNTYDSKSSKQLYTLLSAKPFSLYFEKNEGSICPIGTEFFFSLPANNL